MHLHIYVHTYTPTILRGLGMYLMTGVPDIPWIIPSTAREIRREIVFVCLNGGVERECVLRGGVIPK